MYIYAGNHKSQTIVKSINETLDEFKIDAEYRDEIANVVLYIFGTGNYNAQLNIVQASCLWIIVHRFEFCLHKNIAEIPAYLHSFSGEN